MSKDQMDAFSIGKSTDQAQLDHAISIVIKNGYYAVKDRDELKRLSIEAGYKVAEPILVDDKIVTLEDLRNYFCRRLYLRYPSRHHDSIDNVPREIRLLRLLVEARQKTGLNKFNAIQECVAIIDTIFDYEDRFSFNKPINITMLGQKSYSWVTEKAITILNEKLTSEHAKNIEKQIDELDDIHSEERDKARGNKLDNILKNMGNTNG